MVKDRGYILYNELLVSPFSLLALTISRLTYQYHLIGNFTKTELEKAFICTETNFKYLSHIPRPTFSFGGAVGQTITTIAFSG